MSLMNRSPAETYAAQQVAIGVITPSGNTAVERIGIELMRDLPSVSMHFSRVPVHGHSDPSPDAYRVEPFAAAAGLLAHAEPKVLLWNGSKGCAIGFEHDRRLASQLSDAAGGLPVTTSTLALEAVLKARGITRIALVTPHVDAYQRKLIDRLASEGLQVVSEAHAGEADNLAYAAIPLADTRAMMLAAGRASALPQAVVSLCTNFAAGVLAAEVELELGLPVFDTLTVGYWHALQLAGVDTGPAAARWGSVFAAA